MSLVKVAPAGGAGVIKDLSNPEIVNHAWTDASNIRFIDGMAQQTLGHTEIYASPSVNPLFVMPLFVSGNRYWIYGSSGKLKCVTSSGGTVTHTDLTRSSGGDYTASNNTWTGCLIGGIPVMNNGTDAPQAWDLNLANKFTSLSAWPASTTASVIRTFKNYLVALNVTKSSTNYPFMVKWSHPADPGSLPASWDHTDATKDAGESDLSEGYDKIIDGLQLRDSFMIYKESSVWRMDFVGGIYVFRFSKVLGMSGAMGKNCVIEADGLHFVLTNQDVVIHDGQSATSVLDKQTRRYLFNSINPTYFDRCFVFKNPYTNEAFVCYPEGSASIPNRAMVWNWKDRTVSFRDLPSLNHAACGPVPSDAVPNSTWSSDSDTWDSDISSWSQAAFAPDIARVLFAPNDTKLYLMDAATTFNGSAISAHIERQGLTFDAPEAIKTIRGIRPRISGTSGGTVIIKVGYADNPYDSITWGASVTYTIGSQVAADCFVSGRYIAIRFETGTATNWRLDSYDVDVEYNGLW